MPPLALPLPELAAAFMLRRDITFLNHGSFGACPRPVYRARQRWQRELEAQPVAFLGRRLPALLAAARVPLAAALGAQAADLLFVPNATHGVNLVARALPLRPGDEVLTTDHEYGACDRTWRFVCAGRGARFIRQPIALPVTSAAAIVEQVWAGVTARTRVLFLSHITSPTALILPVAELCRRARQMAVRAAPVRLSVCPPRATGAAAAAGRCPHRHGGAQPPSHLRIAHGSRASRSISLPFIIFQP